MKTYFKTFTFSFVLLFLMVFFASCSLKKEERKPNQTEEAIIPTTSFPMGAGRRAPIKVTPTYLPKKENFQSYVKRYYELVKANKFEEAYKMSPTERRSRDTLENFSASLRSMPIQSYEVGKPIVRNNQSEVQAVIQLGGMAQGSRWIVVWYFQKDKKKGLWEVKKTQSTPVQ